MSQGEHFPAHFLYIVESTFAFNIAYFFYNPFFQYPFFKLKIEFLSETFLFLQYGQPFFSTIDDCGPCLILTEKVKYKKNLQEDIKFRFHLLHLRENMQVKRSNFYCIKESFRKKIHIKMSQEKIS